MNKGKLLSLFLLAFSLSSIIFINATADFLPNLYIPLVKKASSVPSTQVAFMTSTPTSTKTATSTPSPTPTSTSTATPTPTPTVKPCSIVSGNITTNTTWTADCVIRIVGPTLVEYGITLTIEPGVKVIFDGYYDLWVSGNLVANGTEEKPIRFTSGASNPKSGDWKYINLKSSNPLPLSYLIIEYSDRGLINNAGLDSSVRAIVSNATIQHNNFGIDNLRPLKVENSYFINNSYYGITNISERIGMQGNPIDISNSVFTNNNIAVQYLDNGGFIHIGNSQFLENKDALNITSDADIHNNLFTGNSGNVAFIAQMANASGISLVGNKFIGNDATGFILDLSFTPNINFEYNLLENNKSSTGILNISTSANGYSRKYNTITNNEVIGDDSCIVRLENRNSQGYYYQPNLNYSNITQNIADYDVCARNSDGWVTNNYWGTTSSSTISSRIYDFYDNHDVGYITYEPFMTEWIPDAPTPSP